MARTVNLGNNRNPLEATACLKHILTLRAFLMKHASNCFFISIHCIYCCISRFAFYFSALTNSSVNGPNKNVPGIQ